MMSKKLWSVIISLIFISTMVISGQKGTGDFKMGASQVNITPDEPVLMSGYAKRSTPSTAVHDSLYASALFFTGNKKQVLLITTDLIGFSSALIDEIKKEITGRTGIPAENILITAVHNHGGPSTRVYETNVPESTDRYVSALKKKLADLSASAAAKAVPYKMGTGKGSCSLNINRRAVFANGYVGLGRDQDKPCDHDLVVSKFEDMNGKTIALLINWPCHGTASGQDNYQITGDWPGYAAKYVKDEVGNNVIVAVTAGASADINPIYGPGVNFNEISTIGYHVAKEAVKVLSGITVSPVRDIQAAYTTVKFPGKQRGTDNKPPASFEPGQEVEIRLSGLKIGDLVMEGISGELMTEYGMQVKQSSPYGNTIIITHCNGSSGYICTDQSYKEGGYEIMTTRMMPGIEKPLLAKFMEQIKSY